MKILGCQFLEKGRERKEVEKEMPERTGSKAKITRKIYGEQTAFS